MKRIHFFFIYTIISVLFICCSDVKIKTSLNTPEIVTDTLLSVIDKETSSFYAGNYEKWKDCWMHDSISSQTWNNDDGSFSSAQGWQAIDKQGKDWIEKYYKNGEVVIHPEYFRREIKSRVLSDTSVWLTWVQYNAYTDKKIYGVSREMRLMLFNEGSWKISQMAAFWDSKNRLKKDSVDIILARK